MSKIINVRDLKFLMIRCRMPSPDTGANNVEDGDEHEDDWSI